VKKTVKIHNSKVPLSFDLTVRCEGVEECLLPKMTIQPLVENSLSYVKDLSFIDIFAYQDGETLVICITDSGKEADDALLNQHLSGNITLNTRSTGLGIRGVNERIAMSFGEEYGLHFEKNENGCTKAVVRVPVKRSGEDKRTDGYA